MKPLEAYKGEELVAQGLDLYAIFPELCLRFAQDVGLSHAVVPAGFPVGHADRLRSAGIILDVDQRFFDDRRRVKSAAELEGIRQAQARCRRGHGGRARAPATLRAR